MMMTSFRNNNHPKRRHVVKTDENTPWKLWLRIGLLLSFTISTTHGSHSSNTRRESVLSQQQQQQQTKTTILYLVNETKPFDYSIQQQSYRHYSSTTTTTTTTNTYSYSQPQPQQQQRRQRRQLYDIQYRSVLIVRMIHQPEDDQTTVQVNTQLHQVLFEGIGQSSSISVRKQMDLCSGGRVILEPAPEGIITVTMSLPSGMNPEDIDAWKDAAAGVVMQTYFSSQSSSVGGTYLDQLRTVADHVVLILPSTFPDADFVANAEISSSVSIFTLGWCHALSSYMHELGHNLMLRHAGVSDSEPYGDTTGYMGFSVAEMWLPQKCYNAAQHWQLGWYDNHRISLVDGSTSPPALLQVAAFVDHKKITDNAMVVLVQVQNDMYLQFNRAKEYNQGTDMMVDQIVLIRDQGDSTRVVAGMDPIQNPVLQINAGIFVRVCSININYDDWSQIDYAIIAIGTTDSASTCNNGSGAVSSPPQQQQDQDQQGGVFQQQQQAATSQPTPSIVAGSNNNPGGPIPWTSIPIPKEQPTLKLTPLPTQFPRATSTNAPSTPSPTTFQPTTVPPTTEQPTTIQPTTLQPTTVQPTTLPPTTIQPSSLRPTTASPTGHRVTSSPTFIRPLPLGDVPPGWPTLDPWGVVSESASINFPTATTSSTSGNTQRTSSAASPSGNGFQSPPAMIGYVLLVVLTMALVLVVRWRHKRRASSVLQSRKRTYNEEDDDMEQNNASSSAWYPLATSPQDRDNEVSTNSISSQQRSLTRGSKRDDHTNERSNGQNDLWKGISDWSSQVATALLFWETEPTRTDPNRT